jgi:hypothetical protein
MIISKILPAATKLASAAALLTLAACEPHTEDNARAFFDPHYEHQLHTQNEIPRGERLYFREAPQDPVLATNTANPANYSSIFRGRDVQYLPNPAANAKWPEPEGHHHGDHGHATAASGPHAGEDHGKDHGAIASPPAEKKSFFPEDATH